MAKLPARYKHSRVQGLRENVSAKRRVGERGTIDEPLTPLSTNNCGYFPGFKSISLISIPSSSARIGKDGGVFGSLFFALTESSR
jgi:hypothetical protein